MNRQWRPALAKALVRELSAELGKLLHEPRAFAGEAGKAEVYGAAFGASPSAESPWINATDAGRYLKRSRRFIQNEVRAGRLRSAKIGGRGEILTRKEWCDEWVEHRAALTTGKRRS